MELTISHLLYGLFTLLIIMTMIFRKGVVLLTLLGTFVIAWVYKGDIISGFTSIFNANLVAAQELFSIFLIITFMLALLHSGFYDWTWGGGGWIMENNFGFMFIHCSIDHCPISFGKI